MFMTGGCPTNQTRCGNLGGFTVFLGEHIVVVFVTVLVIPNRTCTLGKEGSFLCWRCSLYGGGRVVGGAGGGEG